MPVSAPLPASAVHGARRANVPIFGHARELYCCGCGRTHLWRGGLAARLPLQFIWLGGTRTRSSIQLVPSLRAAAQVSFAHPPMPPMPMLPPPLTTTIGPDNRRDHMGARNLRPPSPSAETICKVVGNVEMAPEMRRHARRRQWQQIVMAQGGVSKS